MKYSYLHYSLKGLYGTYIVVCILIVVYVYVVYLWWSETL